MTITDDVRKTLTDPTPLYAVAGTADLALEKLREVPALVEKLRAEAPDRIAAVRETDPKDVQEKVTEQAKQTQARVAERLEGLDTDIKKLRENATGLALQSVGRAAEYAVKARETYDDLAERGRGAVSHWRGEDQEQAIVTAEFIRPEPATAEPEPEAATAGPESKANIAGEPQDAPPAAPKPQARTAAKKTAAKKTAAKKAAPKKSAPKSDS